VVVGTFGARGELKVEPLSDVPERFAVYLGDDHVARRVLGAHPHKRLIVLHLEDVADMTAAERLRGQRIWIPGAEIAPLPPDHYYIHDLVGLRVEHVNGEALGTVVDVLNGGGNDLLVVRNARTGVETLVPAAKAFIRAVDLVGGSLTLDPIPGLFDDRAEIADGGDQASR
jgi:16S rRNA processing protein RimM